MTIEQLTAFAYISGLGFLGLTLSLGIVYALGGEKIRQQIRSEW